MGRHRTDITDSRLRRLLHHIPQLSGQHEISFSRHDIHFDLKGISAHTGPGQSAHDTHFIIFIFLLNIILFFPQKAFQAGQFHSNMLLPLLQHFPRRFPADFADPALQASYAGFLGIAADDFLQRLFADGQLVFFQPVGFHLLGNQMLPGNMIFFILRITGNLDDLHTVQQRPGNRLHIVCRGDKQDFRQIQGNLNIMIRKFIILLRIQHLQQRRGSVPFIIAADFINFIQKHQRVFHSGLF